MPASVEILFTCHDLECPGRPDDFSPCTFHQQVPLDDRGRPQAPGEVIGPECRWPLEPRNIDDALERWRVHNTPPRPVPRDFGPLGQQLWALRGAMAQAAQRIYDDWEQPDGQPGDGICDDITEAIAELIDAPSRLGGWDGDEHAWLIVTDGKSEAYQVDIHYSVYEHGSLYNWTKIDGVVIGPDDVTIAPLDLAAALDGYNEDEGDYGF